jgi:hypothetical protein
MPLMFKGLRYKIIYLIMAIAVGITMSTISIIAFTLGLLLYLLLSWKWKLAIGWFLSLPLITLGLLKLQPDFFTLYGKMTLWKDVFLGSIPRFFVGHGIGSFPLLKYKVMSGTYEMVALNAECEPLQLLSDGGLILLVLIVGYVLTLYRRIILEFLSNNSMLLIGYSVGLSVFTIISLKASPLHYPALLLIGLVYLASLEAQTGG